MQTALLYARYSTAMQSQESVEDQFRLLRERAAREEWVIEGEFADRAISGTVRDRPGLNGLLAELAKGRATIILAESLDRISRDQEDMARFFKQIEFAGARIITLSEGEVGAIHIGLGSTIAAVQLKQIGEKVRRGQRGRVEAGRIPGGKSFGYRMVRQINERGEFERGLREVDEGEAEIVRRIFREYSAGIGPIEIARTLNKQGIPAPRGGEWNPSTIVGNRKRGNGILHNQLYRGIIVYDRQSFRKDPITRKRVARINPDEQRASSEVPELRIISEQEWQAAQSRLNIYGNKPKAQCKRPKRLLSGLIICDECQRPWTILSLETWGCSHARKAGTCSNRATVSNAEAERRIWSAISGHMLHPDVVAAYLEEFRLATADARRAQIRDRASIDRRIADLEAEEERIVDAIIAGMAPDRLKARSLSLAAERAQLLEQRDANFGNDLPEIHPGIVQSYRTRVERIAIFVNSDEETRREGFGLIRELIEKIVAKPRETGKKGAELTLHGRLASLLSGNLGTNAAVETSGNNQPTALLVAGVGFVQNSAPMRIAA